jgi:tetratricopeptide (TPR) repeat protein
MERLSVIVTAHNQASLVRCALASVAVAADLLHLEPDAPDVEVVAVDDGSSDDTAAAIAETSAGHPRWRPLRQDRSSSPVCARNVGAAQATGSMHLFLNGDDLFLSGHLRACWHALRPGGADFVKTAVRLASPVHPDWSRHIEGSLVINLAVRRGCHEAIGGFPVYHLFHRDGDVFFKNEDQFDSQALAQRFRSLGVVEQTVEYCRYPGNAYDRHYEKFRQPFGQHRTELSPEERFRLRLAEVIVGGGTGSCPCPHAVPCCSRAKRSLPNNAPGPAPTAARSHPPFATSDAMPTLEAILDQARHALAQKQPAQAERLIQRALELSPNHPAAWRLLADARRAQGKHDEALAAYQHLARLAPDNPEASFAVAVALLEMGREDQALAHLQDLLGRWPEHAEALLQAGVLLAQRGRLAEGLEHMSRAVQLQPESARARNNLAVALAQAGRPQDAQVQLEEALRLEPGYAEAGYNLGNVLGGLNRRDEAVTAYRKALALRPDHFGVLNNLGLLLQEMGRPGEAAVLLRQATRHRPDSAEAHNNLGLALADLGRFAQAEASYHEALRLAPGYTEAHSNLGCTLKELGRIDEALACFDLALLYAPESRSARYNRGLTLLQAGQWQQGFCDYEYRWGRKSMPERRFDQPRWDGSSLEGKTVLVWSEQGLGDTIQFVRFAPLLGEMGARVVLECPGLLIPLLSTCAGIDQVVVEGQALPPFAVQVPLLSLPGLLGATPERVPGRVPYLSAEPVREEAWRQRLPQEGKFRVGIVWQGNPRFQGDRWRSAPLETFAPLARVEGAQLVCLQRGPGLEQVDALRGRFAVTRPEGDVDGAGGAFLDTAALMKCLDLVVCVDTAGGHLAGALGVSVWLALSAVADWRWLRKGEDTVWYPSMRLFRQRVLGEWHKVFAWMAEELRGQVAGQQRKGVVGQGGAEDQTRHSAASPPVPT